MWYQCWTRHHHQRYKTQNMSASWRLWRTVDRQQLNSSQGRRTSKAGIMLCAAEYASNGIENSPDEHRIKHMIAVNSQKPFGGEKTCHVCRNIPYRCCHWEWMLGAAIRPCMKHSWFTVGTLPIQLSRRQIRMTGYVAFCASALPQSPLINPLAETPHNGEPIPVE